MNNKNDSSYLDTSYKVHNNSVVLNCTKNILETR